MGNERWGGIQKCKIIYASRKEWNTDFHDNYDRLCMMNMPFQEVSYNNLSNVDAM